MVPEKLDLRHFRLDVSQLKSCSYVWKNKKKSEQNFMSTTHFVERQFFKGALFSRIILSYKSFLSTVIQFVNQNWRCKMTSPRQNEMPSNATQSPDDLSRNALQVWFFQASKANWRASSLHCDCFLKYIQLSNFYVSFLSHQYGQLVDDKPKNSHQLKNVGFFIAKRHKI